MKNILRLAMLASVAYLLVACDVSVQESTDTSTATEWVTVDSSFDGPTWYLTRRKGDTVEYNYGPSQYYCNCSGGGTIITVVNGDTINVREW